VFRGALHTEIPFTPIQPRQWIANLIILGKFHFVRSWKRFLLVIVITRAAAIGGPGPTLLPLLSFHADEARAQELLLLNLLSDDGLPRRDLILQGDNGAHHFLNQLEPTEDL
jgi:hypothetical protein